jgi:hypothetical protein
MTFTKLFFRRSTHFLCQSIGLCEKGTIISHISNAKYASNAECAPTQLLYFFMVTERLQREVMGVTDGVSVDYVVSPMAIREELETTHCPQYIDRFLTGFVHLLLLPQRLDAFFKCSVYLPEILFLFCVRSRLFCNHSLIEIDLMLLALTLLGNLTATENRKIGFPWSLEGVRRSTSSVGRILACDDLPEQVE